MHTRVLVVDDHPVARMAICSLLQRSSEVDIVGMANGAVEALAAIRKLQPDLVLLDLMMPDLDGFQFLELLHSEPYQPKVVVLSMNDTPGAQTRAIKEGASAFVPKMRAHRDLMTVIRTVVEA